MPGGNLTPELVTPLLKAPDPALREAALRVTASRPAWAAHFAAVCNSARPTPLPREFPPCDLPP